MSNDMLNKSLYSLLGISGGLRWFFSLVAFPLNVLSVFVSLTLSDVTECLVTTIQSCPQWDGVSPWIST
jgi:hypothetical protein